jgi:SNF2 family DNA or RNA helicase
MEEKIDNDYSLIGIKTRPYDYQCEGVEFGLKHHYHTNAFEPGLGKSLTSLVLSAHSDGPCLIVSPAYLKLNWKDEIETHTDFSCRQITSDNFTKPFDFKTKYYLTSYEQAKYCEYYKKHFETIVIDECHMLKNPNSQRSKILNTIVDDINPRRLITATGTPIANRVFDYYTLLYLSSKNPRGTSGVDIRTICGSFTAFQATFCDGYWDEQRREIIYKGVKNIELLKTLLKDKVIRKQADKVLKLPKMISKFMECSYKEDPKLEEAWEAYQKGLVCDHITVSKVQNAIAKVPFTIKLAKDLLEEHEKIVIFSDHREPAKRIAEALGIPYIDGGVGPVQRHKIVTDFQTGLIKGISATIGSMSTGVTLTASNIVLYNDTSWVPKDNFQSSKRILRIGQTKICFAYYVVGGYIDKLITKSNTEKIEEERLVHAE